jgi:hypothetical protein
MGVLNMDYNEFSKSVEDIVLYPGNLAELNQMGEQKYSIMPLEGSQKYLIGIFIPDLATYLNEMASPLKALMYLGLKAHEPTLLEASPEEADEAMNQLLEEMSGNMKPMVDLLGNFFLQMWEDDIRTKAKKLGASGLIHFSYMTENTVNFTESLIEGISSFKYPCYAGVPVLNNPK